MLYWQYFFTSDIQWSYWYIKLYSGMSCLLFLYLYWVMLWPLHVLCRSAKKASTDDWLECFCKRKKTSSRGFYHIYLVFSNLNLNWTLFYGSKFADTEDIFVFLFTRNDNNQLLLGIRRASRPQTVMPSSVLSSDSMHIGLLAAAAHAAATNSRFTIFYNPRYDHTS